MKITSKEHFGGHCRGGAKKEAISVHKVDRKSGNIKKKVGKTESSTPTAASSDVGKKKCNHCSKSNHNFAKDLQGLQMQDLKKNSACACRNAKKEDGKYHYLSLDSKQNSDKGLFVDRGNGNSPIFVKVQIENKVIDMEVDSDAGISVISKEVYYRSFNYCKLTKSTKVIIALREIAVKMRI